MNVQKYFKIVLCSVVLCILIVIGFAASSFFGGGNTAVVKKSRNGDVNILFMATDKGGLLTDTIMVASVSTKNKTVNILSIPRDTKVHIGGNAVKINSAYGMGKEGERINLPIELINEITGLDINYYAVVTPDVVVDVVDTLGGVEFDVPQRMYYVDPTQDLVIDLQPGKQTLDGDKAEQFLRYRSGYANADLGRISAQQEFIKELFNQKFKFKYISKAGAIYNSIKENVDTNISAGDVGKFAKIALSFNDYELNTYQLPGVGGTFFTYDPDETEELIQTVFINHKDEDEDEGED